MTTPSPTTPTPRGSKRSTAKPPELKSAEVQSSEVRSTEVRSTEAKSVGTAAKGGSKSAKVSRKRATEVTASIIDLEYRRALIAEEAYLRAERRNFAPGGEEQDWLSAEAEVDARLMGVAPSRN